MLAPLEFLSGDLLKVAIIKSVAAPAPGTSLNVVHWRPKWPLQETPTSMADVMAVSTKVASPTWGDGHQLLGKYSRHACIEYPNILCYV